MERLQCALFLNTYTPWHGSSQNACDTTVMISETDENLCRHLEMLHGHPV